MSNEVMQAQDDYQVQERNQAQPPNKSQVMMLRLLIYGLPCLIFFYILSIGPAFWLYKTCAWDFGSFHIIYAPLSWLHDNTSLKGILDWYIGLYDL